MCYNDRMEETSGVATMSPKKFWKKTLPKVLPDVALIPKVIRELDGAYKCGLDVEMLPTTLAHLSLDDATLMKVRAIYEATPKPIPSP